MVVKGKSKFRPFKIPRYLPGSVKKDVWKRDLQEYNKHRYRCYTAKTKLDTRPFKMNPSNYIDKKKLSLDYDRAKQIDIDNKKLMKQINIINRTRGQIDSYNPNAYSGKSKWYAWEMRLKKIETENKQIYNILKNAKTAYSRKFFDECWQEIYIKLAGSTRYPLIIFNKPSKDSLLAKLPSISGNLGTISGRPRCFLDFQTIHGKYLGRVIIELYNDYVPITVENFLNLCNPDSRLTYKNCKIHRIIPGQYCETGDIINNNGTSGFSIYGPSFDEENHDLKHTKCGVLSMKRIGYEQVNNSQFCITFDSIEKLDHKNVVFGKIVDGVENFLKLEGYGREIGRPLLDIFIKNCGAIT